MYLCNISHQILVLYVIYVCEWVLHSASTKCLNASVTELYSDVKVLTTSDLANKLAQRGGLEKNFGHRRPCFAHKYGAVCLTRRRACCGFVVQKIHNKSK